jgi:hypothetical protein
MDEQLSSVAPEERFQQQQQQQKGHVADSSSPLDKDDILDAVFSYVCIGDYIFTGAVRKRWKERYTTLCSNAPEEYRKCTTLSSAVTTAARLQHAADNDLDMKEVQLYVFAETVVMYSLQPTIIPPLRGEDLCNWQDILWRYAVKHNKLQLLQSLPRRDFDSTILLTGAARSAVEHDCVAVLSWLHSVTEAAIWTDELMREVFFDAGRWASFDSLEWLREQVNSTIS